MAATFSVSLDMRNTARAFAALKQRAPIAIARGLTRTANSEKTAMAREISQAMGLKVGVVKENIRVQNARPDTLTARVTSSGAQVPLIEFSARATKRGGVTAKLPGGKGRYPHAFIATMGNQHRGVFERVPGARRRGPKPNRSTLPIYELHGPSIARVFMRVVPIGAERRREALVKNVQHELSFALSKLT